MDGLIGGFVIGTVIYLIINGTLASRASEISRDKGYEKHTWFHLCFWLGPIGYILVAAMPDRILREKIVSLHNMIQQQANVKQQEVDSFSSAKDTLELPKL